jgi:hypothetical protein
VPVTFTIDDHHIRLVCTGDYGVDELIAAGEMAITHPAYSHELKLVVDMMQVKGTRTPADINRIVEYFIKTRLLHDTKNAVLVPDSFLYGMARMAQNFAESQVDRSFEIFMNEEELQDWLASP